MSKEYSLTYCPYIIWSGWLLLFPAGSAAAASLPKFLSSALPVFRIGCRFITQMVHTLRALVVGTHRACLFHHGPQRFGIFQHGAGTQHVFIEGLVVVVRHEDGTLEGVQQAGIVDVAVGVVDEYAGLHIALGVDVQIVSSAGDASAYIFRTVLEIHGEDGFALTEFPNPVVYLFPLLRGGQ